MGLCLTGTKADIGEVVFLTNDTINVQWIAENMLTNVNFYNQIRNMQGCTGEYAGKRVSAQGEGIGPVNAAMYAVEIANEFEPKTMVKIDGCKALRADIKLGDIILPQTAHTTSSINKQRFAGLTFPAAADFELLYKIYRKAEEQRKRVHVGPVVSIETRDELDIARKFATRGALAIDMEMNQTFTAGQRCHIPCAGVLVVTENVATGEKMTIAERKEAFAALAKFAFDAVLLD